MFKAKKYEVNWNNSKSYNFEVSNGVKQDAAFSAVYINKLLTLLREAYNGSHMTQSPVHQEPSNKQDK